MKRKVPGWLLCVMMVALFAVPGYAQYSLFVFLDDNPEPENVIAQSLTYSPETEEIVFHTFSGTEESYTIQSIRKITFEYGTSVFDNEPDELPAAFCVQAPYPNPFNPSVTVPFALPAAGEVHMAVVDVLGREVWSNSMVLNAGQHEVVMDASQWNGGAAGSGMYFLRFDFLGNQEVVRMMLVK